MLQIILNFFYFVLFFFLLVSHGWIYIQQTVNCFHLFLCYQIISLSIYNMLCIARLFKYPDKLTVLLNAANTNSLLFLYVLVCTIVSKVVLNFFLSHQDQYCSTPTLRKLLSTKLKHMVACGKLMKVILLLVNPLTRHIVLGLLELSFPIINIFICKPL